MGRIGGGEGIDRWRWEFIEMNTLFPLRFLVFALVVF